MSVATRNGCVALGVNAGEIAVGRKADLMLADTTNIAFSPAGDTLSNLLYAAHSDCIDTVVCNGRVVMQQRQVADEQLVKSEVARIAKRVLKK